MRRRIYDVWNVLKAANIIVEHGGKTFSYNSNMMDEVVIGSQSDEEIK